MAPQPREASRQRQLLRRLVETFRRQAHSLLACRALLKGSLYELKTRCGKPSCHCARPRDPGHPIWTWTFMVEGRKQTQHVPKEWLPELQRRVRAGREFQNAIRELLAINAQLVVLARRQRLPLP